MTTSKTTKKQPKDATSSVKKSKKAKKNATCSGCDESKPMHFGWRFFWVCICAVVSTCLLIAIDDLVFGTGDRILANYTLSNNPGPWEGIVATQLAQDIIVPICWGTLFTFAEALILFKVKVLHRGATSAILIAALWLLPIALAVIRIVSFYAFIY